MFCRRIWHRVGPLAQKLFSPVSRTTVPVRRMAFGVPGGSTNMTYFVLCGGGLTAAVVYAYKTVNGDTERYEDRLANMNSQAKVEEAPEAASEEEPASESVPVEPAAEISAEPVDEAAAVEVSEVVVTEASSVSEEAAPVVVEEGAPEAAPEVPAEAPAAESAGTTAVDEILPVPASGAETPSEAEADPGPAADVTA